MKLATIGLVAALGLTAAGCENMNSTQRRTLTGAGVGAGTGALIGGATGGSVLGGAALGGAAGAGGGYLYDRHQKGKDPF
ncbi:MAG TPA: hypothetical protein VHM01_05795 [Alphaproteobacteria bacterium]|nr:hypothetical protein [Alphaproteobacteria bacterium]